MSLSQEQQQEAAALLPDLLAEEKELQFSRFTNDDALTLGNRLTQLAKAWNKGGVTISITRNGQVLFQHAMAGTSVDNENWMRRKTNTVVRLQHSSYYIGRSLAAKGETDMERSYKVSMVDYACHGGGFPLLIRNVGCVGAIVVSGLKQAEDHALVVQGIREMIQSMESKP
ncbi:hypothetical protein BX616_010089 [Lobosporangium transversale]|uniref:Uncharacterized protein n=1 Tax=Lobosporangium transversale TaxID=64571 RepID=A0A1Y2GL15_9FUNG|nr:hypothetical protein BCR41DRAFT_354553 [Lobosporangium transversale]KAF9913393.1 hypothetical protein BX616_010089 [Lobosporangium transversale]ORZ14250.1 hypothetical protein BCR41DRAFT_354553 [Lobosporangium transversale]|eukprot:XP_021880728.1 hypothetical protein BCR41DRAFT_354553 [Lobosporangium transversale]